MNPFCNDMFHEVGSPEIEGVESLILCGMVHVYATTHVHVSNFIRYLYSFRLYNRRGPIVHLSPTWVLTSHQTIWKPYGTFANFP